MKLQTFQQFNESDNFITDIEDLILSLQVDNIEMAQQLMIGQNITLNQLFNGDLDRFCNAHNTNLAMFINTITDNTKQSNPRLIRQGNNLQLIYKHIKVTTIPITFLQRYKAKHNINSIAIKFNTCTIQLADYTNLQMINAIWLDDCTLTTNIECNSIMIKNCHEDVLKHIKHINNVLSLDNIEDLDNLASIIPRKLKKLTINGCRGLRSLINCPAVKDDIVLNDLILSDFTGISNAQQYTFSNLHIDTLNGLPKKIEYLTFSNLYLNDIIATKADFENVSDIQKIKLLK